MRRSELRGGADEYRIKEVLGDNFQQFVVALKAAGPNGLGNFTIEKLSGPGYTAGTGPNQPKGNDIDEKFFDMLAASAAAFRQIENPEYQTTQTASKYAENIYAMYDALSETTTGGAATPKTEALNFKQLPYHEHGTLKYLNPVFHYFPYVTDIYPAPGYNANQFNSLVNAIRYLYHFIALLKLDDLDVRDVMILLRSDNLGFMKYVGDIVEALTNPIYYGKSYSLPNDTDSKDIIEDGVINGLTAIAVQIINEYRTLPVSTGALPVNYQGIEILDFAVTADVELYIKNLGVDAAKATIIRTELAAFTGWGAGAKAVTAAGDAVKANTYAVNALRNPIYANETIVEKQVDAAFIDQPPELQLGGRRGRKKNYYSYRDREDENIDYNNRNYSNRDYNDRDYNNRAHMTGGGDKKKIVVPTKKFTVAAGGKPISFPFLYGPVIAAAPPFAPAVPASVGKRNLVTEDEQDSQTTAKFTSKTAVEQIYKSPGDGVIGKLITNGQSNEIRVVLTSLLDYLIENNKTLASITAAADKKAISDKIKNDLTNFTPIITRIRNIPTDISKLVKGYSDHFVTEFIRATAPKFAPGAAGEILFKQPTAATTSPTKSNLADQTIYDFYDTVVTKDSSSIFFYKDFFNLIREGPTSVSKGMGYDGDAPLREAKGLSSAERSKYRLNVKKLIGISRLRNIQYGGGQLFNDIVLIGLIPDYPTDGSVGGIWTSAGYIDATTLGNLGTEAIRQIARDIFSSAANTSPILVLGQSINLVGIAKRIADGGYLFAKYPDYFKTFLRGLASTTGTAVSSVWKEGELVMSEHMFKEGNMWVRDGDDFKRVDKNGNEIPGYKLEDNCQYIANSTRQCLAFIETCLPADNQTDFNNFCRQLLDFDFKTNPGMTVLKDEVQKINPAVAFAILRQMKFGSYLEEEPRHPVKGFRRFKVQSVGSWLEELMTGLPRDRCQQPVAPPTVNPNFNCGPLKDQLGDLAQIIIDMANGTTPNKTNFFNYLDILVHWVNANPQVLNPEELLNPEYTADGKWPNINKSFKTYHYVNPYKPAEIRLRGISCGLGRLKSNIMNELSGANGNATISSIAGVPLGIEMPLNRYGFMSPAPFGGLMSQFGGSDIFEAEREYQNIYQPYGYILFQDIYNDLLHTMENLVGKKRMSLTENTRGKIDGQLDKFKKTEEELRKSLINLIERNKLYQASHGHINSYVDDKNKYAAILAKHSNLLSLSNAYNRKAVNLIDYFQTISKAILNKIEDGSTTGTAQASTYERPITMGYHYGAKKN
jgi:hypothetical protein